MKWYLVRCNYYCGLYLCSVREREDRNIISYALSLSFRGQTKHYKIEKGRSNDGEKYAIEDGPKFGCLMDVSIDVCTKMLCSEIVLAEFGLCAPICKTQEFSVWKPQRTK